MKRWSKQVPAVAVANRSFRCYALKASKDQADAKMSQALVKLGGSGFCLPRWPRIFPRAPSHSGLMHFHEVAKASVFQGYLQ
jgi:hypothetical protein